MSSTFLHAEYGLMNTYKTRRMQVLQRGQVGLFPTSSTNTSCQSLTAPGTEILCAVSQPPGQCDEALCSHVRVEVCRTAGDLRSSCTPHLRTSAKSIVPVAKTRPRSEGAAACEAAPRRCPPQQQVFTSLGSRVHLAREACARQQAGKLASILQHHHASRASRIWCNSQQRFHASQYWIACISDVRCDYIMFYA